MTAHPPTPAPGAGMTEVRRLLISGQVQGVGFRYGMQREARRLGASGWVRNLHSGEVEAVVSGPPDVLAAMIAWTRRGPPSADVDHVHVELAQGSFDGFEQRPTA